MSDGLEKEPLGSPALEEEDPRHSYNESVHTSISNKVAEVKAMAPSVAAYSSKTSHTPREGVIWAFSVYSFTAEEVGLLVLLLPRPVLSRGQSSRKLGLIQTSLTHARARAHTPVSYTHLTLPTRSLV